MAEGSERPGAVEERGARGWRPARGLVVAFAVLAAGMSVLWLVVVPEQAGDAQGWRLAALRWGHSACWALLAVAAATHAAGGPRRLVSGAARAGLAAYLAFLAALAT